MDAKKIFTNRSFCVLPWTGFELEPDGSVKNCIISKDKIGNIHENTIQGIMLGEKNTKLKQDMLEDRMPKNCSGCHLQEQGRKKLMSISSRLYYNKEIAPSNDMALFQDKEKFSLQHVDLRWTNQCNQACVYCGPSYSSKWAKELGEVVRSKKDSRQQVKEYVFDNVKRLKNVYLAGGEPLLMNENKELLISLKQNNPDVNIRVNTNLSSTQTGVFELLCDFKNVHWTISAESMQEEYEYIRHHGIWNDFVGNLNRLKELDHKISFNMLFFILNYHSIYDTINFFRDMGYHENSFIIGPLYTPAHFNVLNLPDKIISGIKDRLQKEIAISDHYLKNSYENILAYIENTTWNKNASAFVEEIKILDQRRGLEGKKIFKRVFEDIGNV
jgi:radical SAM protein with 4Fe4S-binding SPASM domain